MSSQQAFYLRSESALEELPHNFAWRCDEVYGNDAPRLAKLNCPARGLPLLPGATQSPIRQFMLNGGRDEKTSVAKSLPNYGNRVNNVVQTIGEIEQNIRINGDELWPV